MKIEQLSFAFTKDAPLLFEGVSLELLPHQVHVITGKNGTGKSTLLRIISVMHRGHTACVPQQVDAMLALPLTVRENLHLAQLPTYPGLCARKGEIEALELLHTFSIDLEKAVELLSGGQRQIVAILMSLQKPVELLLLDEPTAALDEENAHIVFSFLQKLVRTTTTKVALICHDQELIAQYAHSVITLERQQGKPCQVRQNNLSASLS